MAKTRSLPTLLAIIPANGAFFFPEQDDV